MSIFNDLLKIYTLVDTIDTLDKKLSIISQWVNQLEGITRAGIYNHVEHVNAADRNFLLEKNVTELKTKNRLDTIADILPSVPGTVTCKDDRINRYFSESGWTGTIFCYPVISGEKKLLGALLFKTEGEIEGWQEYDLEFKFLCIKLKQIFETDFLKDKLEKENDFLNLFINQQDGSVHKIITSQNSNLINWLNLPLYIMDTNENFIYVNNVFLNLLKINNIGELKQGITLFPRPSQRKQELELLAKNGRVDNYKLTVNRKDGYTLDIRDSALLMGSFIFGFFFDVTELVRLNRELKEALEMQEFLNDKLISSSLLLQRTQTTTIRSLARLAEYRDGETGEHLDRICSYSAVLTQEVYKKQPYNWRVSEKYIYDLIVSSMLHDIGKVGVPDSILLKPGKLTNTEFKRMQNHTIWGWAILNKADMELGEQSYLTLAASIALHHHEQYNGTGYPHQLIGEKIPLSARIEAIADVYDALTSRRPYKNAWPHEQAVEEIIKQKGEHFDPVLVEIFLNVEDKFFNIRNKMDT